MNKPFILLFLLFGFQQLNAQWFYDTSYRANGKIAYYGIYDKEKKCYRQYHYYYQGSLSHVVQYDSSDFTYSSSYKAYNENGTTAAIFGFNKKGASGLFEEHYPDGTMKRQGNYYNGFKTGNWFEYHPNGIKSAEYAFTLSKEDSAFDRTITEENTSNLDSISTYEKLTWGQEDSSLGRGSLRYANIIRYGFRISNSSPSGIWKKYDLKGKLISKENFDKRRRKTKAKGELSNL